MEFTIIGDGGKRIIINVLSRPYSTASDSYSANWLNAHLKALIPGFEVSFDLDILTVNIQSFMHELKKMHKTLTGSAELSAVEGEIHLRGTISKTGHIIWETGLTYPTGIGAKLSFEFESNQSYLPQLISELDAVLKEFPVIKSV